MLEARADNIAEGLCLGGKKMQPTMRTFAPLDVYIRSSRTFVMRARTIARDASCIRERGAKKQDKGVKRLISVTASAYSAEGERER